MNGPTHASFFSGVGGLDLGLERAGWRTVSFSEIDPYASAVLAERWPGVPNLGDIVVLNERAGLVEHGTGDAAGRRGRDGTDWTSAALWTGGFPCQDLSVAGKRRGMVEGTRSNLAHAFLDLVERHRPPAVLLENVPGLLSSHRGRDMAALLGRLAELGYGVAYRVLDARHFGVPPRRRRVFILGLRSGPDDPTGRVAAERAAAVLSVGSRCDRHPPTGIEAGPGVAAGATPGVDIARAVTGTSGKRHDDDTDTLIGTIREHVRPGSNTDYSVLGPPPDPRGNRKTHGLARGLDDSELVGTLRVGAQRNADGGPGDTVPIIAETLNSGGNSGGFRTEPGAHLVSASLGNAVRSGGHGDPGIGRDGDEWRLVAGAIGVTTDSLLPLGLDSHRYRCCGNGVVANVAEWIGRQLLAAIEAAA